MFSANENLLLRQHKRRIVDFVESTMPENALDMGTTVMVMQVSCKAPGCVPLETAIIIVFPKVNGGSNNETAQQQDEELVPGLPESGMGGSYKTKILKPMSDVTKEDVLEALPPAFKGGKRSMEKLCMAARDVMLAQITQLFGEDDQDQDAVQDRKTMAEYLQQCLQDYIDRNCKPPELGEPFAPLPMTDGISAAASAVGVEKKSIGDAEKPSTTSTSTATAATVSVSSSTPNGNFVIRRDTTTTAASKPTSMSTPTSATVLSAKSSMNQQNKAIQQQIFYPGSNNNNNNIAKLFEREHAPGIRQAGCPCCDPNNPSTIADKMMML